MYKVAIVMGSDSDLPVMKESSEILEKLGIPYDMTIISAHRAPQVLFDYAKSLKDNGFCVVIAGAGGAAHLPGVTAALTALPVIGVPVSTPALNGVDSLYSIVQMPKGIPVATVAINGGLNAGLLAAQIIGSHNSGIYEKLMEYKKGLETTVLEKAAKLKQNK